VDPPSSVGDEEVADDIAVRIEDADFGDLPAVDALLSARLSEQSLRREDRRRVKVLAT
jgi:hypothetical protein